MANTIRFEDRLEGAANYVAWKVRIMIMLKENKVIKFIKEDKPEPEDEPEKTVWNEGNDKVVKS